LTSVGIAFLTTTWAVYTGCSFFTVSESESSESYFYGFYLVTVSGADVIITSYDLGKQIGHL